MYRFKTIFLCLLLASVILAGCMSPILTAHDTKFYTHRGIQKGQNDDLQRAIADFYKYSAAKPNSHDCSNRHPQK